MTFKHLTKVILTLTTQLQMRQSRIVCSMTNYLERPKFIRKEKILVFQVTIDYSYFKSLQTEKEKQECIAVCFLRDIQVLRKFNPKGFVVDELRNDFKTFFQNIGWLGEVINMI